jgi:hypothetical protein
MGEVYVKILGHLDGQAALLRDSYKAICVFLQNLSEPY